MRKLKRHVRCQGLLVRNLTRTTGLGCVYGGSSSNGIRARLYLASSSSRRLRSPCARGKERGAKRLVGVKTSGVGCGRLDRDTYLRIYVALGPSRLGRILAVKGDNASVQQLGHARIVYRGAIYARTRAVRGERGVLWSNPLLIFAFPVDGLGHRRRIGPNTGRGRADARWRSRGPGLRFTHLWVCVCGWMKPSSVSARKSLRRDSKHLISLSV